MRRLRFNTDQLVAGDLLWVEMLDNGVIVQRGHAQVLQVNPDGSASLRWVGEEDQHVERLYVPRDL